MITNNLKKNIFNCVIFYNFNKKIVNYFMILYSKVVKYHVLYSFTSINLKFILV